MILLADQKVSSFNRFDQIRSQHFHSSVLDFLPEAMQSLQDRAASGSSGRGDMGMFPEKQLFPFANAYSFCTFTSMNSVTKPDLDAPVFVYCIEGCGTFRFPG